MCVDRKDYIIYGWKLPYDIKDGKTGEEVNIGEEQYEDYAYNSEGYTLIQDGMCGEYIVFGELILTSDDYNGWQFTTLDIGEMNSEEAKQKYREVFNVEEPMSESTLFIFSHY